MENKRLLESFMLGDTSYEKSPFVKDEIKPAATPDSEGSEKTKTTKPARKKKKAPEKVYVSVRLEEESYKLLVACQAVYQFRRSVKLTLSDTLGELVRESPYWQDIEEGRL